MNCSQNCTALLYIFICTYKLSYLLSNLECYNINNVARGSPMCNLEKHIDFILVGVFTFIVFENALKSIFVTICLLPNITTLKCQIANSNEYGISADATFDYYC